MGMFTALSWHFYKAARPCLTLWRRWMVLGLPIMGLLCVIGSSSRGAVVGVAGIGVCMLLRTKLNLKVIGGVAVVAMIAWFIVPPEQKDRFSSAGTDATSITRKVYWLNGLEFTRQNPVLGIGYENWLTYYAQYGSNSAISDKYEVHSTQLAHNIFIQCMAELGYAGLFVFVLLIVAVPVLNARSRRAIRAGPGPPNQFLIEMSYALDEAMLCYLIAGFFVTVLYYPFFWINFALTVALNAVARQSRVVAMPRKRQMVAVRR
jgi:O-antigen ligase